MKRLVLKHIIAIALIVVLINSAWLGAIYLWSSSVIRDYFSDSTAKSIRVLSEVMYKRIDPKEIKSLLKDLHLNPAIAKLDVVNKEGKVVYAQVPQKREHIITFLNTHIPLEKKNKIIGYLKIWPTPESVVREITRDENMWIFAFLFFLWLVLLISAMFFYIHKVIFAPFGSLKASIDQMEKDDYTPINLRSKNNFWQDVYSKVNRINEKLSDTTATLNVLFSASNTLTSSFEINEIFQVVLNSIRNKFGGVSCSVILMGEDGFLRIKSQQGLSPNFVQAIHLRPGESFVGESFKKSQVIVINDITKEQSFLKMDLFERENLSSCIYIPLIVESKCVGLLNANSPSKNFFTSNRVQTLSTFAEYLSIGLRNAKLYERIQEYNRRLGAEVSTTTRELIQTNTRLIQKAREMKALSDIAASAASKVNLSEILGMVVEQIKKLLSAQSAGFFLYSASTKDLIPYPPFFGIRDRDFSNMHFQLGENSILESVIYEKKYFLLNNVSQAKSALPFLSNLLDIYSLVLVPLRSGEKAIGVLGVTNKFGSPFNKDDLRILELIADRISGIIENVRLYQELQRRLRDLTTLQEISSSISSEPVLDKTLKKIISSTTKTFNADLCDLLLYNEESKELLTQPGAYFTGGEEIVSSKIFVDSETSILAKVFREGRNFVSPDASIDPQIKDKSVHFWDIRSLILVPLKAENQVIGVLRIGKHQANSYTKEHLGLAGLIANQAAIIIENARLYDSLRDAKDKLEKLNQIKNEFISVISHELKTPITAVKGFVKVVLGKEAGELNPQQEKFLNIAYQGIDRLINLINELLDISNIESGKIRLRLNPLNPREVADEVVRSISVEAKTKKLTIEVKMPVDIPMIVADRGRLFQIFDNLLMNSIKFTMTGGTIVISAKEKGDFVAFCIKDTGIGISQEDQKKIFEKFFRVDSAFNRAIIGAGLGLSIVKSIIEIHGGQIWVESEPDKGTSFMFTMPKAGNIAENKQADKKDKKSEL